MALIASSTFAWAGFLGGLANDISGAHGFWFETKRRGLVRSALPRGGLTHADR